MAWREEIADRAQNGDAAGVLEIFDRLQEDRERVRQLNVAYLDQIAALKGGRPAVTIQPGPEAKLEPVVRQLTAALKQYRASL